MSARVPPDLEALKSRLRDTWTAGDFGQIARWTAGHAEEFVARLKPAPGLRVLDVACGTGNLSIPAARAGAVVSGVDIAPNLLAQARVRARAEVPDAVVEFREGDAEALPYPDGAFDLVMTMYGAMFAPRPERVAAELVRVCRPGGRIAMANWTPRSFVAEMFRTTAAHVPPPPSLPSPLLWGDEATVRARLRDGVAALELRPVRVPMRFPFPPEQTTDFFRAYYGPTLRAFAALPPERQAELRRDLVALWSRHNRATDGTTHVEGEYLEVVATRA
jgi:SAM-dependent methyltransferase